MYQSVKVNVLKPYLEDGLNYDGILFHVKDGYEIHHLGMDGISHKIYGVVDRQDAGLLLLCWDKTIIKKCDDWNNVVNVLVVKIEKTIVEL